PPNFVPAHVVYYIYQQADIPRLHAFIVRLAKLALDSDQVPPIDPDNALKLVPYHELLRWADSENSAGLSFTSSLLRGYSNFTDHVKLARRLHMAANLLRDKYKVYDRYSIPCICKLTKVEDDHSCTGASYTAGGEYLQAEADKITDDYLAELLERARQQDEVLEKEREILRKYREETQYE
ncbi:hypothetical protein, partial [Halalkalibacter oceani]|uniref:hypothetical protein n=1 Tax=Halalkalibacter oceani TaxID=1653776 RepID=UPI0035F34DCA